MWEGLSWDRKKDRENNISVVVYGWKAEEEEIVGENSDEGGIFRRDGVMEREE